MIVVDFNDVLTGRSLDGTALTTNFEIAHPYGGGTVVTTLGAGEFVVAFASCFDPTFGEEPDCELRAQIFSRDGHPPCVGDCNRNGQVTVDELIRAVRIAVDGDPDEMRACLSADRNLDYAVDIAELVGCQ